MANVSFKFGTLPALISLNVYEEGALYFTTDEGGLYMATGTQQSQLKRIGDYVEVANVAALASVPTTLRAGALYYAVSENVLCKYDSSASKWVQINLDTGMTSVEVVTPTGTNNNVISEAVYCASTRKLTLTKGIQVASSQELSDINDRLTSAEGDINTISTYLDEVEETLAEHSTNITSLWANMGTAETDIDNLQALHAAGTHAGNKATVAEEVAAGINALNAADSAVSHEFVTAVSETNGVITVSRAALTADDIPSLTLSKISDAGDVAALDEIAEANLASALANKINGKQDQLTFTNAESGNVVTDMAFDSAHTLTETKANLGDIAIAALDANETGTEIASTDALKTVVKKLENQIAAAIAGGVQFKGTWGTGGTISSTSSAGYNNPSNGDMYKFISDCSQADWPKLDEDAQAGDWCIYNAATATFMVIDVEDEETWRNVKVNGTQVLGTATTTGALQFLNSSLINFEYDSTNKGVKATLVKSYLDKDADQYVSGGAIDDNTLNLVVANGTNLSYTPSLSGGQAAQFGKYVSGVTVSGMTVTPTFADLPSDHPVLGADRGLSIDSDTKYVGIANTINAAEEKLYKVALTEQGLVSSYNEVTTLKNPNALAIGDVNYDGSAAVSIAAGNNISLTSSGSTVTVAATDTGAIAIEQSDANLLGVSGVSYDATTRKITLTKAAVVNSLAVSDDNIVDGEVSAANGAVTLTLSHKKVAGTGKASYSDINGNVNSAINIVTPTYDEYGHVTGTANQALTVNLVWSEFVHAPS